jgi:hypothetical protein
MDQPMTNDDFTFEIVSKKHGCFAVAAPARFRAEIERHRWYVIRDSTRAPGREFIVAAYVHLPTPHKILMHRLVWELAGRPPASIIDHVDGQSLNNSEKNLRDGTLGNAKNRQRQRSNTSGVIGVSWCKRTGKYVAKICGDGRRIHIGYFSDIEAARAARDAAAIRYHEEFAVLNTPREQG